MNEPTLPELLRRMQVAGGHFGNRDPRFRAEESRDLAVARLAYQSAKILDESELLITQEQADYICSVIATRVGVAK